MTTFIKDPSSVLDFGFDWSDWLDSDDSVSTSTWNVPTGITDDSDTSTSTTTTIWLSGGTVGSKYKITNRIVTANGRTVERSFYVKVESR
jgi:hypothetical protein